MPAYFQLMPLFLLILNSCIDKSNLNATNLSDSISFVAPKTVRQISMPAGFSYTRSADTSCSNWLLDLELKDDNTVYLHDGRLKSDQTIHYRVLDIDIGKKDLVQCADAAMKLRGDFLFNMGRINDLNFIATSGDTLSFSKWLKGIRWREQGARLVRYKSNLSNNNATKEYDRFMELVFSYCGTYSLSRQLTPVHKINSIQPGDVFIQGGFPGHALTVMAVAENRAGEKIFLLSQGYMPAQDIHILKNFQDRELSPWYSSKSIFPLYTPQWQFESGSLKRWE